MDDVQNQKDYREIKIQQTGVNNVCLPFFVLGQRVQAFIKFTVSLDARRRGTHMSRLIEILTDWTNKEIDMRGVESILNEAIDKLNTDAAHIKIDFKYFVERQAPISGKKSLLDIDCCFDAALYKGQEMDFTLGLNVPLTTLCPCSREISDFGAHNQRSICRVKIQLDNESNAINIDNIAKLIEAQASSPIYPLLKREDEKFVTEHAYDNPKFVEDILRDVVIAIRQIKGILSFSVECENFESIHNHNAVAGFQCTLKKK